MKIWIARAATLAALLFAGLALHVFLAPKGYAWVVWTLGTVVLAFFVLEIGLRMRKRATERSDWRRWKASLGDPRARRTALNELRREIGRARRLGPRLRVRHTRLAVVAAELQLAGGASDAAVVTLSKIDVSTLEPLQAVIVRIARAQAYLHGDDVDGAIATLSALDESSGDAVLDASATLVRGAVALEEGRLEEAEGAAREIVDAAEEHDELWDEAKALEAACAHACGESADVLVREIRAPGRERLSLIGSARIRRMLGGVT